MTLKKGGISNLTYTVNPNNADIKTIYWQSNDENIATVENGKVTAIDVGSAQISVIVIDYKGNKKIATCNVIVQEKANTTINNNHQESERNEENEEKITIPASKKRYNYCSEDFAKYRNKKYYNFFSLYIYNCYIGIYQFEKI